MKYRGYSSQSSKPSLRDRKIHPIWRGVGFVMMALIPVISWAATETLIKNNLLPLPRDLIATRGQLLYSLFPDPLINIKLITIAVIMVVLYVLFMFLTFLITSLVMGSVDKYDPYYVPPVRRKVKKAR
jgi:hypothetical protein